MKTALFLLLLQPSGNPDSMLAFPLHAPTMALHNAMQPADLSECQRAAPERGRPDWTISRQQRSNEPWFRRTCGWNATTKEMK